ncbi:hypothetical protein [Leptolyngbya sp. FACHB-16]|uniref:hypothetical protein n=1 Tax=unclassified Leptolyngbya TaxID=2650499 RepID=UPI0016877A31|nr:hypothetical protein [Leptolyngbya sp. FACHB-16]MBD2153158.1 hypothetical protein [Leptolyngbya sp. FACHB-16]
MTYIPAKLLKVLQWISLSAHRRLSGTKVLKNIQIGKNVVSATNGALLLNVELQGPLDKNNEMRSFSPAALSTCMSDEEYYKLYDEAEVLQGQDLRASMEGKTGVRVCLDAQFLMKACEAAIAMDGRIHLEVIDGETGVKFCCQPNSEDDGFMVTGVLMPMISRKASPWDWTKKLKSD